MPCPEPPPAAGRERDLVQPGVALRLRDTGNGRVRDRRIRRREHVPAVGDETAVADDALDECHPGSKQRLRLLEIDDVNPVTFAKDVGSHLRVPEAGLMSEMDTRFQHLSH